ncbi:hypothetical protein K1719_014625 [Acacia pycnantha]|nr:hypothetical protein K1719_014625 [Acacia pycnantha]
MSAKALDPKKFAETAINSIGLGYDLTNDLKLYSCKKNFPDPRLIAIDKDQLRTIELPNGISVSNVSKSIKCDKGERMRLCSDVLSFQQMSEQFNQELSLSEKTQVVLRDHVKQAVPSSWDPAALARFIEKFGTHVVVGVKIGGTDMIYAKQQFSSSLQPTDVQKKLKEIADRFFVSGAGQHYTNDEKINQKDKFLKEIGIGVTVGSSSYCSLEVQDIKFMCKRKGGINKRNGTHTEWCRTVPSHPDVISMSFIPITSLLSGVNGSGFLTHAINLYLRYKAPLEELHQFLEFQLPRQWAPIFGELALGLDRKPQSMASLQFSLMGPKLHVNTTPVDVGEKPVTGLRLYLEGKKGNRLAIHLQHLSSQPQTFQLENDKNENVPDAVLERKYFEKVQWKSFSHVCTAPVESYEDNSLVTGARFEVKDHGLKKVLYLRLTFAKVVGATRVKAPDWHGSPSLTQKSGMMSALISGRFSNAAQKQPPNPADVHINSALYPNGPPVPTQTPKLLKFVDTTEITRGPQDSPGYWVVSGARLFMENGKISLKVKYSLLTVFTPDEEGTSF